MASVAGQWALVTGASSGIGLELARLFARDGYSLVMTADDEGELAAAAADIGAGGTGRVETVVEDLSTASGPERLHDAVHRICGTPDFLVNNAGAGVHGRFAKETDLQRELAIIQLNVISTVQLTKMFGREMAERGSGRIVITSSVAGIAPSPKLTVYSATKAFDYAFAEALAHEMREDGVTVTALLPAETETEFFARAGMEDTEIGQSEKADPAAVAQAGYSAMMKGADHVLTPFSAKMRAALVAVMPERLVTQVAEAN